MAARPMLPRSWPSPGPTRTEEKTNMSKHSDTSRTLGRAAALAGLGIAAAIAATSSALAGECPAGKMTAGAREPVSFPANGVTDTVLAAIPQAHDRAGRCRSLAQPWRSPGDHLHRRRRDRRICQQLRRADRTQDRRDPCGDQRDLPLVEESRNKDRGLVRGRRAPRQERSQHVAKLEGLAWQRHPPPHLPL
jgi:hypothetical protein